MQNKFEQVLIKENHFLNSLNSNAFGTANSFNFSKSSSQTKNVFIKDNLSYNSKTVPDDEDVRKNISHQINFVSCLLN